MYRYIIDRFSSWLPVVAMIIIAISLWSIDIGGDSLWIDESGSVYVANISYAEILDKTKDVAHPPTYAVVLRSWVKLSGSFDSWTRYLSVLFMVGTTFVVYVIGRTMFSHRVGLLAMVLFISNPFIFYFAQEVRSYSMLIFFVSLSFMFVILAVNVYGNRFHWYILFLSGGACASILALGTHYGAVLVVPCIWLAYVFIISRKNSCRFYLIATAVVFILAVIIYSTTYLPYFLVGLNDVSERYGQIASSIPVSLAKTAIIYSGGKYVPMAILFTIIGVIYAYRSFIRNREWERIVLFSLVCFVPSVLFLVSKLIDADMILHPKFLGYIIPIFSVFIAYGFMQIHGKKMLAVISALLICHVVGIAMVIDSTDPPWKEAMQIVAEKRLDNVVVVTCWHLRSWQAETYLQDDSVDVQTYGKESYDYDDIWFIKLNFEECLPLESWGTADELYTLEYGHTTMPYFFVDVPIKYMTVERYVRSVLEQ